MLYLEVGKGVQSNSQNKENTIFYILDSVQESMS